MAKSVRALTGNTPEQFSWFGTRIGAATTPWVRAVVTAYPAPRFSAGGFVERATGYGSGPVVVVTGKTGRQNVASPSGRLPGSPCMGQRLSRIRHWQGNWAGSVEDQAMPPSSVR